MDRGTKTAAAGDGFTTNSSCSEPFDVAPRGTCCGEDSVCYHVVTDAPSPVSEMEIPGNAPSEGTVSGPVMASHWHVVLVDAASDGTNGS